jgi:potassium efflux system protein
LAFLGILIFTIGISKIVSAPFKDEWMVNFLPRGLAPAISLVLRIIMVGIGLYVGFTAAGADLSKLEFIIVALGVGIGSGLQNVVLNFVSGLILAFERPINIGDTIEVDMEMGFVTNIGVRSSNIKAYSGAEVIIPNGDLISKKVVNWTLSNRSRRSKVSMKTSPGADPESVIELLNKIATNQTNTDPETAPSTYSFLVIVLMGILISRSSIGPRFRILRN